MRELPPGQARRLADSKASRRACPGGVPAQANRGASDMSAISAETVKKLRERTNLPMMDCKNALTEENGDIEKAVEVLRTKFKGVADKRGGRGTGEGRIAAHVDGAT